MKERILNTIALVSFVLAFVIYVGLMANSMPSHGFYYAQLLSGLGAACHFASGVSLTGKKTAYQGAWLLAGNGIILNYHLSLQLDKRWFSRIESIRLSSGRTSIVAWRGWARFLVWPPLSIEVRNKNGHKEHDSSGMTQGHQNGAIASIRALPSRMASSPWVRRTCGFSARAAIMKSALSNPRREAS